MSSDEHRRSETTGIESQRIRFRHDGRNKAAPFATVQQAMSWKSLLDAVVR